MLADDHNAGLGQPGSDQPQQRLSRGRVECIGRITEHHPVRLSQQQPRKGEALNFSAV